MRAVSTFLSCVLVIQLIPLRAQEAPKLNIVIVEGEGAINNIRQRTAREPIVQVEDENRKPVAGAVVVFTLPTQGASGTFANGTNTLQVITDEQGRAVARGLHPNNVEGNVQIRVNASSQGRTGSAIINQNNVRGAAAAAAGGVSAKLIAILAIAGGAAAGIAVAATRGNGGTTTTATPPVTISPTVITTGAGSVSAPRP